MKAVALKAEPRTLQGKQPSGRLRRSGSVPGIVYGSEHAPQLVQLNEHDLVQFLKGRTSEHFLLDLDVTGCPPCKALIKEIQRHAVSHRIEHVDLNAISMTRKLRIEVPIKLVGEPVGVAQQGGVVDHMIRSVLVECLPSDIPEQFILDIAGLSVGERFTVANIVVDAAKITVLSAPGLSVVAVAAPRAEEEVAPTAAAGAVAEPEVLTAKKPEEGEEAAAPAGKDAGKKEAGKEGAKAAPAGDAAKKGAEAPKKK